MQTKITSFMCPQKGHNTGYKFFLSPPSPGKCYNFQSELTTDHKKHNKHRGKKGTEIIPQIRVECIIITVCQPQPQP